MRIDLRTERERREKPVLADVVIETPVPPWTDADVARLEDALLDVVEKMHSGEPIEVFCARGKRAKLAIDILRHHGIRATDVTGRVM
jgi:rhodanese-related sulfurtransferase